MKIQPVGAKMLLGVIWLTHFTPCNNALSTKQHFMQSNTTHVYCNSIGYLTCKGKIVRLIMCGWYGDKQNGMASLKNAL
jgi:hypothetical protein